MNIQSVFTLSLAGILFTQSAKSQNLPYSTLDELPSELPVTGKIPYPPNLNASPNTTPTFYNYKRVYKPLTPVQSIPAFDNTPYTPILVNTVYGDGLGNPLMEISRTNAGGDIVTPAYNRISKTGIVYLPYITGYHSKFIPTVYAAQRAHYKSYFASEDTTAYSKTVSGTDTLGVPFTRSYAPGKAYVGQERGAAQQTTIYEGNEIFILSESSGTICKNGYYPAGSLIIKTEEDVHKQVTTYLDKSNRLICKRTAVNSGYDYTYYVYSEMGKLTHVLTPLAAKQLISNSCVADLDKLCYTYVYDAYGSVIEKGTPGKTDKEYIVYDRFRRPVLTTTPLLQFDGKWSFVVYDNQGRVAFSGLLFAPISAGYDQANLQLAIDGSYTPATNSVLHYIKNPVSGSYPSSLSNCEILSFNYYDSYAAAPASNTTYDNSFTSEFLTGGNMETPAPYLYAKGRLVASTQKVVNTGSIPTNFVNNWITSVFFYDEKGRLIQTQTLNPWNQIGAGDEDGHWDVTQLQYDFTNNVVLSIGKHFGCNAANKPATEIRVRNIFNTLSGRLEEVRHKIDNQQWQVVQKYTYDALGKITEKWLGGTEEQHFSFTMSGRMKGLNEYYIKNPGYSFAPTMTYAEIVSTGESDEFATPRYDGSLSGFRWRTAGGNVSAYGYEYDEIGRMTAAHYRENAPPSNTLNVWTNNTAYNNTVRDFTVADISYDANGNMTTMKQYGYDQNFEPDLIDVFTYTYPTNSNQLASVQDAGVSSPIDDFDNSNANTANYTYDADGNLAEDDLKGIMLAYNYQDLPVSVIQTNNRIDNIYDASGALLQKRIITGADTTLYHYWGPFTYRNDSLLFVMQPEGRCRWVADTNVFRYDYFVKDHLGNIRTTVTTDANALSSYYLATHEVASAAIEKTIFDNIDDVRDTRPQGDPWNQDAALLNSNDPNTRIGTSLMLNVMAGDKISLQAYSYHEGKDSATDNFTIPESMLEALLTTLANGYGGFSGGEANNGTDILNNIFVNDGGTNAMLYDELRANHTNPVLPRAYLNYLFFDESNNLVQNESGVIQVSGAASSWEHLSTPDIPVRQSGRLLIYISNEQAMDVYFDNISVSYTRGRLIEENHYYPHGLLVQSSYAAGVTPENRYKHQGKLLQKELGMELYDFHARQYDPQIGRFWGIDPADQFPSGYTGMGNDPANMVDPSGMTGKLYDAAGGITRFHPNHVMYKWNQYLLMEDIRQEMLELEAANSKLFALQASMEGNAARERKLYSETIAEEFQTEVERKRKRENLEAQMQATNNGVISMLESGSPGMVILNGEALPKEDAIEFIKNSNMLFEMKEQLKFGTFTGEESSNLYSLGTGNNPDWGPTMTKGGLVTNFLDFYTFMVDAANNAVNANGYRAEVAAFEFKNGIFFVQPWADNVVNRSLNSFSWLPDGYTNQNVIAQWHTHPSSTPPSPQDLKWQRENGGYPVRTIGADGKMWQIHGQYPNYNQYITPIRWGIYYYEYTR